MDVSVIIPMYNGGELIHEQLDTLAAQQTDLEWEVVVGDNRSTDGSPDAVRARAKDFPVPLRVVDAFRVAGAGHARNEAARVARGRVLAMCDADDLVAVDWVEQAFQAVEDEAPMAAGLVRIMTEPFQEDGPLLNPGILHGRGALSGNMAVLRDVFIAVGGFDESLPPYGMEDSNLSARVLHAGHAITPAPEMVVYFRPTRGVLPRLRKMYRSGQSEVVIWSRGLERQGQRFSYPQLALDAARVPMQAVNRARRAGIGSAATWAARQGAVRLGRLVGLRTWVRNGRAGAPVYPFLSGTDETA